MAILDTYNYEDFVFRNVSGEVSKQKQQRVSNTDELLKHFIYIIYI